MTEQQEFLSLYMFETGPGLANALDNFSFLEGSLIDQLMSAIRAGSWRHIDSILNSIGVYLNVAGTEEVDKIFEQGAHGYYLMNGEESIILEMAGKRKPIFDGVCKAYNVDLEGFEWA